MNKQAQVGNYAIAFMIAVAVIILALAFAPSVNEITTDARNETAFNGEVGSGMNCSSSVLDDFTNAGCLVSDMAQGFFIGGIMAIAGIVIAARVVFG